MTKTALPDWMASLRGFDKFAADAEEAEKMKSPFKKGVFRQTITLPKDVTELVEHMDPLIPAHGVAQAIRELDEKLLELVQLCRREGSSWTDIGKAIGVTKQAAWERFSGEE